jgi:hypothetical protein
MMRPYHQIFCHRRRPKLLGKLLLLYQKTLEAKPQILKIVEKM